MRRVLKLFDMGYSKRTSAKQIIRLDVDRWECEADVACVAAAALAELAGMRNEAPHFFSRLASHFFLRLRIESCLSCSDPWPWSSVCQHFFLSPGGRAFV